TPESAAIEPSSAASRRQQSLPRTVAAWRGELGTRHFGVSAGLVPFRFLGRPPGRSPFRRQNVSAIRFSRRSERLPILRMKRAAFAAALALARSATAGPYADDMAKCFVAATTSQDKTTLVQWMFAASSLHPAVKAMTTVSDV